MAEEEINEQLLVENLIPIFPHLTRDVIELSVHDPSNRREPLQQQVILQSCIDDLLEMRTYTYKTLLDNEERLFAEPENISGDILNQEGDIALASALVQSNKDGLADTESPQVPTLSTSQHLTAISRRDESILAENAEQPKSPSLDKRNGSILSEWVENLLLGNDESPSNSPKLKPSCNDAEAVIVIDEFVDVETVNNDSVIVLSDREKSDPEDREIVEMPMQVDRMLRRADFYRKRSVVIQKVNRLVAENNDKIANLTEIKVALQEAKFLPEEYERCMELLTKLDNGIDILVRKNAVPCRSPVRSAVAGGSPVAVAERRSDVKFERRLRFYKDEEHRLKNQSTPLSRSELSERRRQRSKSYDAKNNNNNDNDLDHHRAGYSGTKAKAPASVGRNPDREDENQHESNNRTRNNDYLDFDQSLPLDLNEIGSGRRKIIEAEPIVWSRATQINPTLPAINTPILLESEPKKMHLDEVPSNIPASHSPRHYPPPVRARTPAPVKAPPPASVNARPPSKVKARPPAPVKAQPPAPVKAQPPAPVKAPPPAPVKAPPPAKVKAQPPAPVKARPPAKVKALPPAPVNARPPAAKVKAPVNARPPAPVNAPPPAIVKAPPQAVVNARPPAAVYAQLPAAVYAQPPAAVYAQPPAAVNAQPPAAVYAQPPAAVYAQPPAAVNAQPPAAVYAQPPAAVYAQPPAAVYAQPPAAVNAQPPAAVCAQPPALVNIQTTEPNEHLRKMTAEVHEFFPDAQEDYIKEQLNVFGSTQAVCNHLLENKNYPKIEKRKPKKKPEPEIKLDTLRSAHASFNYCYAPTRRGIIDAFQKSGLTWNPGSTFTTFRRNIEVAVPSGKSVILTEICSQRPILHLGSKLDPVLQAEVNFLKQEDAKNTQAADQRLAETVNEQQYQDESQLIECGCCYVDAPFERMVQCYEGHLFCKDCLKRYAEESVYGQGKAKLLCMTDGCDATFPTSQINAALPESVRARYEDRVRDEAINLAKIDDLVSCPHCDFKAVLDPQDKVFRCLNEECLQETCRYCKENWADHFGLRCEEIEKKDEVSLRTSYEEKMTMALLRTCHACQASFTKIEGCNKMTCRCGAKMCYICRKPDIDYNHFCRHVREPGHPCDKCTACSLWSNPEEDDKRAVSELKKEAMKVRKEKGYEDDKEIGAPERKKHKSK
ncbi:uncharacterized protein LOC141903784 isoform X2 [Tubulanus polymorphus]|uniref:uncharacterized protein LOC141903784 isoform X2 n=1 Tax=Tubulanus polymorphus TaxID=672921 RepID=UPI003DA26E83